MKLIIPILGVIALTCSYSVFGQEESPSPAAEQKAPAVEGASPAPSAPPTTTTAPAQSPAAAKKTASPAAATTKPAATAAAATSKKMSVETTLKENENRWEAAFGAKDVSVPQAVVANDFAGVYWDGKIVSKSRVISQIKKDKDTYQLAKNEKLDVHRFGPNVAVVIGTAHEKGTTKDGKPFDRTFRFTDTWVERNGQWQCVASQVMKLKG
jgi:ketosteroid isomerase-like protein